MGKGEKDADPEIEEELVTLSPVNDIQESAENGGTFPSEVILKDLLLLTDKSETTKVSDIDERNPPGQSVEWSSKGDLTGSRKELAPEGEDAFSMHRNAVDSPNLFGDDLTSEEKLKAKAPETPVVLKPTVKRKKKPVVIKIVRKTRDREPENVGIGGTPIEVNQQDRNFGNDPISTSPAESPLVPIDTSSSVFLPKNIGLRKRTRDKSSPPPEMGFLRMKIPSVIYREDAWFPYEDENGILTYIALEKATRRYRKRLSFLHVLILLVSIIGVLSLAAVGASLYAAWDLWFLMLIPLALSLGVLAGLFIVRLSLRPHRIISLMKHYYRVDVLAFTESSAVIYDHHDSVSDFSFHYSDFPFDEIRSRLSTINKAPVSIHDEENVISILAKCADIWNSKKKEFHEVPVATRNSLLYRCIEALLPYSIIISHSDTMRTVRELTLPARWDEEKSLTMNPLFVQFCGLRGILDIFNTLIKEIDESISLYDEQLHANVTATQHYYGEFSRLAANITGISQIKSNDDSGFEQSFGKEDHGPVAPLAAIIRKFSDETRGKREWIGEEHVAKIADINKEMETEIDNERTEINGKSSEVDFQIKELELETEGLRKEMPHIERTLKDGGAGISEASEKGISDQEKERLELESERIKDKLDRNEKLLALLSKRARELDDNLATKISKIEKVYQEKKSPIESEKKMELADVEKEVNVLKGLRDEIMKIALGCREVFSEMEEKEIIPFMERSEDMKKIRKYLVTAIENDRNELTQGIKPTEDLKFTCDQTLPLSCHFPFWSIQLSTGETSVILPMLMCEDGEAARSISDNCAPTENVFKNFYPSQAEFEDFFVKRVRTDEDYFPSKKLMASPGDMKKYSGVLFTERFLKMVEKKERYLW